MFINKREQSFKDSILRSAFLVSLNIIIFSIITNVLLYLVQDGFYWNEKASFIIYIFGWILLDLLNNGMLFSHLIMLSGVFSVFISVDLLLQPNFIEAFRILGLSIGSALFGKLISYTLRSIYQVAVASI